MLYYVYIYTYIYIYEYDAFCTRIRHNCVASFPHDFRGLNGHQRAMQESVLEVALPPKSPPLRSPFASNDFNGKTGRTCPAMESAALVSCLAAWPTHIVLWQPAWSVLVVLSSLCLNLLYVHFEPLFRSEIVLSSATRCQANLKCNAG